MKKSAALGFTLVVMLTVVAARTQAQGPPVGPIDLILQKLDAILAILTPGDPVPGPVTLSTGFLEKRETDLGSCALANVSTRDLPGTVRLRKRSATGATLGSTISFDGVPAGHGLVGAGQLDFAGAFRCEFSFEGFPDEVRVTALVRAPDGSMLAALDAR
jgi:hypothetical protein